MKREEAIETLKLHNPFMSNKTILSEAMDMAVETLENTSKLSNELTSFREGIKDENVLIGFNMAIAICNKYLGE